MKSLHCQKVKKTLYAMLLFGATAAFSQTMEYTASISAIPNLKDEASPIAPFLPSSSYHVTGNPTAGHTQQGQAYVTWEGRDRRKIQILEPEGLRPQSYFGFSAAINDEFVIVGAPADGSLRSGKCYLYSLKNDIWRLLSELQAPDANARDEFGYSVSIDQEYVLVGTPSNDEKISNGGAVYIFKNNGSEWTNVDKLFPRKSKKVTGFGSSLQIVGPYLIVGAYDPGAYTEGVSFAFELHKGVWREIQKFNSQEDLVAFLTQHFESAGEQLVTLPDDQLVAADEILNNP